jgi:hypothetical protein
VLCFVIIAVELEIKLVLNNFDFLRHWFARGIAYFFIGIMTYDEGKNRAKFEDHQFNAVCTLSILGLGAFYIFFAVAYDASPAALSGLLSAQGLQRPSETESRL